MTMFYTYHWKNIYYMSDNSELARLSGRSARRMSSLMSDNSELARLNSLKR